MTFSQFKMLLAGLIVACSTTANGASQMINSITPVLPVDRIEPSIAFFEKVGLEKTTEVPEGDHLGFVILANSKTEVMYQTRTSIAEDTDLLKVQNSGTPVLLFIQVPDVKAVAKALEGEEVVMEMRDTFYGATEISYREPGGHIVTFAQFAAEE